MDVTSITHIAGLIGEARRIKMLAVLLDGHAHSASALGMAAEVTPQTASSHLSKLLAGGLITVEACGRQRLFRLKNADVAKAIEALGAIAHNPAISSVPEIRFARSCYDHLAGMLAIALRNQLVRTQALRRERGAFTVTPKGNGFFRTLEIDVHPLHALRRSFAHGCLDWTEREHHIGGAVGASLLSRLIEMKWLARMKGTRALRVTHAGERGFQDVFNIRCPALRAQPRSLYELATPA